MGKFTFDGLGDDEELVVRKRTAAGEFSPSEKFPGWDSSLIHGDDGIAGQAVTRNLTDDELNSLRSLDDDTEFENTEDNDLAATIDIDAKTLLIITAGLAVVVGVGIAAVKLTPKVAEWYKNRRKRGASELEASEVVEAQLVDEIGTDVVQSTLLSQDEWNARLAEALLHEVAGRTHLALSAQQLGELANSRIVDAADAQEIVAKLRALDTSRMLALAAELGITSEDSREPNQLESGLADPLADEIKPLTPSVSQSNC